ncbi:hypothetical protein [Streptomyces sp. NPDC101776]|uniref:hypothetical protein n=1 Tax=Streptomyces sp. NPDC101776 TaxID=3366146 RepID=UPI0038100526
MNRRQQLDNQIAAMLRAGDTHQHIVNTLNVGNTRVCRVRDEHHIPLPPDRRRPTPDEVRDREARAVTMLRAHATCQQIRATTHVQFDRISELRKQHRIPLPDRTPNRHPGATP